jgi:hypothetical protein
MDPDIYSPDYQRMVADDRAQREETIRRQAALHAKAVARRRKAKRGGKR